MCSGEREDNEKKKLTDVLEIYQSKLQRSQELLHASVEVALRATAIRLSLPGACGSTASQEVSKGLLFCSRKELGIQK